MLFIRKLNVLPVVVLLVCCTLAAAQTSQRTSTATSAAQPSSADEPSVGVISGSVVNEGGQPLAGVVVSVTGVKGPGASRSTSTDAEGKFRVRGLTPALYFVVGSLPAYVRQPHENWPPANYYRIGDTIRITMTQGGVITGKVTNADGEPVISVGLRAVMIRNDSGEESRTGTYATFEGKTDDRGVYRMFGLPAGTYVVTAGGVDLADPSRLNPYGDDVPTYAPSSTRDTASEIVVRAGEETTTDIRYRGEAGHVVSGRLKVPVTAGGSVSLTPVGGAFPTAYAFQNPGGGGFAFKGVADGEYELLAQQIMPPSAKPSDISTSEPRRITVSGADVTGLEFVIQPLASLSGRIVLEPSKDAACENKRRPLFAEMLVTVQRSDRDEQKRVPFLRMFSGPAPPDANGNFALRNLMPGKYLLDPRFFGRYWYLQSVSVAATPKIDAAANWTTVKRGDQLTNFTITLAEGAASIRGHVTTAKGLELPANLGIYLVPAEREKFGDVLRYFVSSVAHDGAFALNNLPPGRYRTLVQSLDAATNTLPKLRLPEATDARAKLRRATETRKIEVELKPCQNLADHNEIFQP